MTSGQGGQEPQQGQPPQGQPGGQGPPGQGWQNPPPQQGWQNPPAPQQGGWQGPQQGWQDPQQGWQDPQQGWQGQPPYGYGAAPSAPGYQFPSEAPERPTTVRVGVGAFMATLILGIISSLVQFSDIDGLVAQAVAVANDPAVTQDVIRAGIVVGAVIGLLLTALQALFIWFAWKGRNWARIVLLVLGGISVLFGLSALAGAGGGVAGSGFLDSLSVFSLLLTIVGVVALALRPSTEWYRAMTARRQAGLR
ncbi:hypothetical protein SAMN05660209_02963 [Geodermatophilus africanus]|uniref:Uncharacterized protein n=1 Tax=Geodermatophilus africanus TaxID=1137993 RepID=A0A1H3K7N8_9ACTN|nr:hypothetical protein [Geodermatophilus africanus]SDY47765.1 hypothetical protein SAMN05660209_02963 [Geodermatophilus africanus]